MMLFVNYLKTSVSFGHANLKKVTFYHTEPYMGDNIVKIMYRTIPYNANSLISLYHALDPNHSVVLGFQCTNNFQPYLFHNARNWPP